MLTHADHETPAVTTGHPRRHAAALVLLGALAIVPLAAHPAPFSFLDVHIAAGALSGRLAVHNPDLAFDLRLESAATLTDPAVVDRHRTAIAALLGPRLRFFADGREVRWTTTAARPLADQDAVEILWTAPVEGPIGRLTVAADIFPYDPTHQTFVNVYEGGELTRQEVLNRSRVSVDFFSGTRQGLWAVFTGFTASGVHHIAIGPDHILFVIGLLLLGGSLRRLLLIVTAFTIGHSITLALATLQIVDPPAHIIEPAIALSIVFVGADNLLSGANGRDVRAWAALAFGLVHGFGFASVLRDTGLPNRALGLSLFSFNLGVEIGQAVIVLIVATALAAVRRRRPQLARSIAIGGSVIVTVAGAYWFVERVFL
jgi:hydrogenase/urease accessory protein HupE